jgi:tetratricopeptide (TPR) repeat protein
MMAAVVACGWCAAQGLWAQQAPANGGTQTAPAAQKPTQEANPFPEDMNSVPVLPTTDAPAAAARDDEAIDYGKVALADANTDPVRSPDEEAPAEPSGGSSSSSAGIDQLLKAPDEPEKKGRRGKHGEEAEQPVHHEGPAEDESVGAYYLERKNWKAALSRFESALVLDPENPDVYWGLGEAERHLGNFAAAKTHYQKLVEYDPDSKHGKEAKKLLKEPDLANAPAVAEGAPAPQKQ